MGRIVVVGDDIQVLFVRDNQLHAVRMDGEVRQAPCEDLDMVLIDTLRPVKLDSHLLSEFSNSGTALVVTNGRRYPASVCVPYSGSERTGQLLRAQFELSRPRQKQAWKQLVAAKLAGQAHNLPAHSASKAAISLLSRTLRSGDAGNAEATGARLYWQALLGRDFRRVAGTYEGLNGLLDYGYAIVRASVARSVATVGMHPSISIQHSARVNPQALCDDLMEPLRPFVDRAVIAIGPSADSALREHRQQMVAVLHAEAECGGRMGPLSEATERLVQSFAGFVLGETSSLQIPSVPDDGRN